MAVPLRPRPLELNGRRKNNGTAFTPPHSLMALPFKKLLYFRLPLNTTYLNAIDKKGVAVLAAVKINLKTRKNPNFTSEGKFIYP